MDKRMTYGGNGSHWEGCADVHWDCKIAQLEAENARMKHDYNEETDQFNAGFEAGQEGKLDRYTDDPYDNKYDVWRLGYEAGSFDRLTAENAALREQVRWIPVNERRPTKNDCATDPLGRPISYVIGCVNGHLYGLIHLDYFDINTTYTHWMPLPQPPEGE